MFLALFLLFLSVQSFGVERVFSVMGTYVVIDMPTEEEVYRAYKILREVERRLSDYIENSEISLINRNAGISPVSVSPLTRRVIEISIEVSKKTYGFFDITVGARTINHIRKKKLGFEEANKLIDYKLIRMYGDTVFLPKKGMAIDLGGVGKGYAVEMASERMKTRWGFIGIAGDMKVWGHRRILAVKDPLSGGALIQAVNRKDLCISTSGNYIKEHIEQQDTRLIQITVVGPDCAFTDAYATALFSMSLEHRRRFLRENPEVGVLELYEDRSVYMNRAFRSFFSDIVIKTDTLSQ